MLILTLKDDDLRGWHNIALHKFISPAGSTSVNCINELTTAEWVIIFGLQQLWLPRNSVCKLTQPNKPHAHSPTPCSPRKNEWNLHVYDALSVVPSLSQHAYMQRETIPHRQHKPRSMRASQIYMYMEAAAAPCFCNLKLWLWIIINSMAAWMPNGERPHFCFWCEKVHSIL